MEKTKTIHDILKRCDQMYEALQAIKKNMQHRKQLLTLSEFCEYTGISKSYAYYLTANNLISYFKPKGKLIYIHRKTADAFIIQNEVKAVSELQALSNNYIVNHKK